MSQTDETPQESRAGESPTRRKTVFVVGADDYNLDLIRQIPESEDWDVRKALSYADVQPPTGRIDFGEVYAEARRAIDEAPGGPDAIIGHFDFPVTSLVSLLNRDYGLPGASPEAVARCEHKYWMRLEQKKVLPDDTPLTRAINPFDVEAARRDAPPFPFWLKPVKAHSSVLGFLVEDQGGFDRAMHLSRTKLHLFGEPFNSFLAQVGDVDELEGVDGNYLVAEELISAPRQFTLEAYVRGGEMSVYGAVDSLREGRSGSSFSRYQYPADLPDEVVSRATEIASKVLRQIGYDNAPCNVEFFWDEASEALHLLEINPRISKSHSPLFRMVDGVSHHKVAIDLALGQEPQMPKGQGKDAIAGKFMMRSYEADGLVRRVPSDEEIAGLQALLPDLEANVLVPKNARLSELFYQDSYSYELAELFLGGESGQMIEDAYARCLESLQFLIQPMPEGA